MAKKTTKAAGTSKNTTGRGPARFRILALDGGGIRGVMTAYWLTQLEKRLGGATADHFDLIAGTSTGSILACALGMRIPAKDIVELYRMKGREIFPATAERLWDRFGRTFTQGISAPKYSDEGLEQSLRSCFGDAVLGDIGARPRVMVTTYNTITRQAMVMKSWREEYAQVPLWEAAKASSSAPTYFPAHVTNVMGATMPLVDGGVVANNPTACAIAEAVKLHGDALPLSRLVVGSFGTGESTRPISVRQSREWGAAEWAVPVISV
ncbi:MAG: patatin-like phospholipase family protein, partial [Phycisphaerales bacterium]|nr:patatin-like phospholipase family protein [Phycisphaerales bacterium]